MLLGLIAAGSIVAGFALPRAGVSEVVAATQQLPLALRPATPNQPISARDRLIAGLEARLPTEIEFVDAVLAAVADGKLPQRIVDQVFFWSRWRASNNRDGRNYRPIIYFQIGMRLVAQKLGVAL